MRGRGIPDDWEAVDVSGGDRVFDRRLPIAISFATAGDLRVQRAGGSITTIPSGALAAGYQHIMMLRRIYQAGTTASGIIVWYA